MMLSRNVRLRLLSGASVAFATAFMMAAPAGADTIKYDDLFRTQALKCIHPTLNVDKATVEILKGPDTAGDVTTVRLKAFYEGWTKKNVMESNLMVRQAGSIRQMSIKILSDTGAAHKKCDLEGGWKDF
jgi:hypothetical protein